MQQRSPPSSQVRPGMTPRLPAQPQQQGPVRPGVTPYGPRAGAQGIQPRNLMVTPQINGYGKKKTVKTTCIWTALRWILDFGIILIGEKYGCRFWDGFGSF